MSKQSWHVDRRTVLRGAGATIALPLLDSMAWSRDAETVTATKRFCAIYFPFGAPTMPEGHPHAKWNWTPKEEQDGSYGFGDIMKSLTGLKNRVTVFHGLSHGRNMGGHHSGDGWLTGTPADVKGGKNTISLDQVVAEKYGKETRFASLVLGLDGGIGAPGRSSTLSYRRDGTAVPAQSNVRRLFDQMFSTAAQEKLVAELKRRTSILDSVSESSKKLSGKLGKRDQAKLDEYLSSIRDLESRIQKQEAWLGKELPEVDPTKLSLDATLESPKEYLQSMFDLLFLAFQTDMTRAATFQIGNQNPGASTGQLTLKLGMNKGQHAMAHNMRKDDGAAEYGAYLQLITGLYGRFLDRLNNTQEGSGNMLDNTLSFYGSSNGSSTHSPLDLPLIMSGGEGMGFKQGQYLKFNNDVPLTNLYATMLDRLGVPQESFADSNGQITSVLRG
jgi:hypothetical protein